MEGVGTTGTTPPFKKMSWLHKCPGQKNTAKIRKSGGKFVAQCGSGRVVEQTSLLYCEHHSPPSHLGRAALYPSFSRLDQATGLKNAGFKVGLVLTKGSAGGAMIINPIS